MIRSNFPMALQGLVVVPLFGGYDERRAEGRLFRYDATGGRWEEEDYMATGSGGRPAKGTLKKRWRPGLSRDDAGQAQTAAKGEALKEEMDEILDEIDSVLEENAEEFVKSYVQKGGE